MILTPKEALEKFCPMHVTGTCMGCDCAVWVWILDRDIYYKGHNYAPTAPRIEEDNTISFEKGASGERVNLGVAKGQCGLISIT